MGIEKRKNEALARIESMIDLMKGSETEKAEFKKELREKFETQFKQLGGENEKCQKNLSYIV